MDDLTLFPMIFLPGYSAQSNFSATLNEDLFFTEEQVLGPAETNGDVNCTVEKKKKKKNNKDNDAVTETGREPEAIVKNEKKNESSMNGKKDPSCKTFDDLSHNDQKSKASKESNGDQVLEVEVDQSTKKKKDKKEKKSKSASQSLDADGKQTNVISEVTKSKDTVSKNSAKELLEGETKIVGKSEKKSTEAAEDGVNESKKVSKKRKRIAPDENKDQPAQDVAVEESKAKKSKGLKEGKDVIPLIALAGANGHAGKLDKDETLQAGQVGPLHKAAECNSLERSDILFNLKLHISC